MTGKSGDFKCTVMRDEASIFRASVARGEEMEKVWTCFTSEVLVGTLLSSWDPADPKNAKLYALGCLDSVQS